MSLPDRHIRRNIALTRRVEAAARDYASPYPEQKPNRDEETTYLFSFTKGLCHTKQGLLENPDDYKEFVAGTETADPSAFDKVKLVGDKKHLHGAPAAKVDGLEKQGKLFRRYESPTAGHSFVLQGPDPYSMAMPPAPKAGSNELAAEMAELYQMALNRDCPVAALMPQSLYEEVRDQLDCDERLVLESAREKISASAASLSKLAWFAGGGHANKHDSPDEPIRKRHRFGSPQKPETLYRGVEYDAESPFLSQFMLIGTGDKENGFAGRESGQISYGNQRIDQRVRVAKPGLDYMKDWDDWLDVQNSYNARAVVKSGDGEFKPDDWRPITTLRDLATYVHDDALYQAYLNAALILLAEGKVGQDPGLPFHAGAKNVTGNGKQVPFAVFGGPHLLTLVTEASSRALRAVRLQKFSVHRRIRPEALAALFHTSRTGFDPSGGCEFSDDVESEQVARDVIGNFITPLHDPHGDNAEMEEILEAVLAHNEGKSYLLPMAFAEGSPMHPSYGAGHATVAGACVTMLKAFFAMEDKDGSTAYLVEPGGTAYVPSPGTDKTLPRLVPVTVPKGLTLESELDKVAWNISNARNMAGVHYYTDYIESLILGENVSLGILRDQMLTYDSKEQVTMTLPLFVARCLPEVLCGPYLTSDMVVKKVLIRSDGHLEPIPAALQLSSVAVAEVPGKEPVMA